MLECTSIITVIVVTERLVTVWRLALIAGHNLLQACMHAENSSLSIPLCFLAFNAGVRLSV